MKPIAPDMLAVPWAAWGFYYPPVGPRVELFFGRKSVGLTETPPQLVEEKHLQMMDPVSSCGKTLPERFRNSIRKRHFPVIFHIASLNLFLFMFSITLTLIAGSLQQKNPRRSQGGIEKSLALLRSSARSMVKIHDNCYFRCSMDHKYRAMAILWQVC